MSTFPIVAVASSAGDLAAVAELVAAIPPGYRAAVIIVQRVSTGRDKRLFDALREKTALPLVSVYHDVTACAEHIYLITPDTTLTLDDGCIRVTPDPGGRQQPGDLLFDSVARECGEGAIGIVLSGEGADGALGVRALEAYGGATLAQYPGSARFPGMPINAIETGCVRFVLRPNEIAWQCAHLSGHPLPPAAGRGVSRPARTTVEPVASVYPGGRFGAVSPRIGASAYGNRQ